jgi:hypothetical protein
VGAAGCGDDNRSTATVVQEATNGATQAATVPTTTTDEPGVSSPEIHRPPESSTTVQTNPTATTGEPDGGGAPDTGGAPAGGEQGEGGAGDEEAVRSPVALTATGGKLSPTVVTVPAFLAVEVTVTATGAAEKVTIAAPGGGGTLSVPAGGRATKTLSGLKPGDYPVTTASGGRTVLHVVNGGDPGP